MDAQRDDLIDIDELARRAGARLDELGVAQLNGQVTALPDARTLRWYTTVGLLDRPTERRGRRAYYDAHHVAQVVAVKRLQADGASLTEIGARLTGLSTDALEAVAHDPSALAPAPPPRAPTMTGPNISTGPAPEAPAGPTSAVPASSATAPGGAARTGPTVGRTSSADDPNGTTSAGPTSAGPTSAGPISTGPISTGPTSAGPISTGSISAGPTSTSAGPTSTSAGPISTSAGPISAGPISAGPISTGPISTGSISAGSISTGSISAGPTDGGTSSPAGKTGPVDRSSPRPASTARASGAGRPGRVAPAFWAAPTAVRPVPVPGVLGGVALDATTSVTFATPRPLTDADVDALRLAAAPLLDELRRRGLVPVPLHTDLPKDHL